MQEIYRTDLGVCYHGDSSSITESTIFEGLENQVDLIFTSPPFALKRKKSYGNLQGQEYTLWLSSFAGIFNRLLKPSGSIVMEMGNTWERGLPTMSLVPLKSLIDFVETGNFFLCQQFIWNNPARLPSPIQWVNIERIRVKDSFTHIWWLAKQEKPKATNRNVLKEYSKSMEKLLKRGDYNSGSRPSQHNIGEKSFLTNNNGAIPSNVFTISNTKSSSNYMKYCKENNLKKHPARMPSEIVEFFIKFLTDPGDLVIDPFGGSNTTGAVAEKLNRNWITFEKDLDYILGSKGRFESLENLNISK